MNHDWWEIYSVQLTAVGFAGRLFVMAVDLPVRQPAVTETAHPAAEKDVPDPVRIRNRRKRYLDLHPEYFGPQLELAGVQLCANANV